MKAKLKRRLPSILIGVGGALVLVCLIYEGLGYPWRLLFAQWGWARLPDDLPDPAPIGEQYLGGDVSLPQGDAAPAALPGQPSWLTVRPPMEVTQLGVIKLPKIQISENIVEGSGDELLYGVGHVTGTALPGQPGNCVLAGHRNYVIMRPFRYLDKMAQGDRVTVSDGENAYTYEVFKTFLVGPEDVWVLQPQEEEEHLLTLLTCTPVMNPTHRLIVWCSLVDTQPLADR